MKGWLFLILVMAGSLLAVNGLRQFFIEPLPTGWINFLWFAIQIAPLLAALPGAMRGHVRGMFVLCIVSTLYFIHGVLIVFDPALFIVATCELFFSLSLCGLCALYVRKLREFIAQDVSSEPPGEADG